MTQTQDLDALITKIRDRASSEYGTDHEWFLEIAEALTTERAKVAAFEAENADLAREYDRMTVEYRERRDALGAEVERLTAQSTEDPAAGATTGYDDPRGPDEQGSSPTLDREALARVIEPDAFDIATFPTMRNFWQRQGHWLGVGMMDALRIQSAFDRADQIIAMLPAPTQRSEAVSQRLEPVTDEEVDRFAHMMGFSIYDGTRMRAALEDFLARRAER